MTYHIQPIARTLSPEQILEPTTTASPPRAGSPMELVYPAQVALQNRTSLETLFSLLDAFMPPNGASHPISETMCFINPTAYEKFSFQITNIELFVAATAGYCLAELSR